MCNLLANTGEFIFEYWFLFDIQKIDQWEMLQAM